MALEGQVCGRVNAAFASDLFIPAETERELSESRREPDKTQTLIVEFPHIIREAQSSSMRVRLPPGEMALQLIPHHE